tara:strand:+ start:3736 stop:4038 length:303 start_codon:yes stop_codon:yes gene_type:complete
MTTQLQDKKPTLFERWGEWHRINPHVYDMFERFTFDLIRAGVEQSSAWLIVNRMRWETALKTKGEKFRISNDYIALYARFFMIQNPEYQGFFKTKELKRV